jgi:type IV pilus assembly protein PilM
LRQGLLKELYMSETIGLDIGSHSIKIVGLKMASRGPYLTALGIKEIPRRKDEEDTQPLIETLKTLLKEVPLKTKRVRVTVSGRGVNLIPLTLPSMPRIEMLEAIRWEVKNQLPFPIETARIDFHILDEFVEEGVKKLDLMVVACPNHLIDQTLSIVEGAGLQTSHLDIAPFALWDAFALDDKAGIEEVVALIDLGAEKTGIHLFKNGKLQFSRDVAPAGDDITRAIMEGLGHEADPRLLYEQAEKIKQSIRIPFEDDSGKFDEAPRPIGKAEVQEESTPQSTSLWMRPVLERLVSEIGRSLDYYRTQFNAERVNRLLLTGGGANLKNIAPFLSNELHLPVEDFNPLREIPFDAKKIDGQLLDQKGTHFTVALGLALHESKRIELLPVREPLWSKIRSRIGIFVLIPLILLLGFSGIIWKMSGEVATLQKDLDGKITQVKDLETLRTKLTLLKEKEEKTKQDLLLLPASSTVSFPYPEILREVSLVVPDNMTLTLFEIQAKGKSFKKGSPSLKSQEEESLNDSQKELHLTGIAFGSDLHCLTALAQIIEGLDKSPFFNNAKLISADENRKYNQPGTEFEIICDLKPNQKYFSNNPLPLLMGEVQGGGGLISKNLTAREKRRNDNP